MLRTAINAARNVLAFFGIAAILGLAAVYFSFSGLGDGWFGEEAESFRLSSPNNDYDAVVTIQEPGAVGSSVVRLYIVPAGVPFDKGNEGYKFEVFRSHTVLVDRLKWRDDRKLILVRRAQDQVQHFDPIRYDPRDIRPNESVQENWRKVTVIIQTDESL